MMTVLCDAYCAAGRGGGRVRGAACGCSADCADEVDVGHSIFIV